MRLDLEETITEEVFEYGNHLIGVSISVEHTYVGVPKDILNYDSTKSGYFRKVVVEAYDKDELSNENIHGTHEEPDVRTVKYAALDVSEKTVKKSHMIFWTKTVEKGSTPTPLQEHIEVAVQKVLSELDKFYTFTHTDVAVDIEVAMEKLTAETSWVEVEKRSDEIASKIDEITEIS